MKKEYHYQESENCYIPPTCNLPEGLSHKDFLGNCGYYYEGKYVEFELYKPWEEDKQEFPDARIKRKDLLFFRYSTEKTRLGRMIPVIAINKEKGKLYFPEDLGSDKGISLSYLTLLKKE